MAEPLSLSERSDSPVLCAVCEEAPAERALEIENPPPGVAQFTPACVSCVAHMQEIAAALWGDRLGRE